MEETLLEVSKRHCRVAELVLNDADEGMVNMAGYHVQQALGLYLKYVSNQAGVYHLGYRRIDEMLRILDNVGVTYVARSSLYAIATVIINIGCNASRAGFRANRQTVLDGITLLHTLYDSEGGDREET